MKRDLFYGTAFLVVAVGLAYRATVGGAMWLLAWPALSFAIVSFGYFFGVAAVFGKRADGGRASVRRVLVWPYVVFAWMVWSLQTFFSREPAWHAVGEVLIVSRRLRSREVPENVKVVVDLTSEMLDPPSIRCLPGYRCIPILDANCLTSECLVEQVRRVPGPQAGPVLIHCANGHGRTGLVAAAWLICHGLAATPAEAIKLLQSARPGIRLRRCQREALERALPMLRSCCEEERARGRAS